MPSYDGMGPLGQGPMTGRGQGYCILPYTKVPRSEEYEQNIPYGRTQPIPGYGRGYGDLSYGRGRGYGRGYGPSYGRRYGRSGRR